MSSKVSSKCKNIMFYSAMGKGGRNEDLLSNCGRCCQIYFSLPWTCGQTQTPKTTLIVTWFQKKITDIQRPRFKCDRNSYKPSHLDHIVPKWFIKHSQNLSCLL